MFTSDQYELLDFGDGRKLERFGGIVIDRPAPAVEGTKKRLPALWAQANGRFERTSSESGRWTWVAPPPTSWTARHANVCLELKPSESGQVGVFPEQADNWDWIAQQVQRAPTPVNVLNLFAYTGGSTLAAAAAGARVTHVDASKSSVDQARRNAELSGLSEAPIRWIVDDAMKFAARELKRGRQYDAVILDPPSYGHGPSGEPWKIHEQLAPLLELCRELTLERRRFMLLTCHTPGLGPAELEAHLADAIFGSCGAGAHAAPLVVRTPDGRALPSGVAACWP